MFKFLHAADLHLDSPLRGLEQYEAAPVARMRQATRRALENLVRLAVEERVAFVLLAGDLYDGDWRDYQTGLFLVKQMGLLRDAGIRVFLISGNHDAENKMTRSLKLPDNVYRFPTDRAATERLDEWDVALHGQGFANAAVKDNLVPGYPGASSGCFNIGLLHTAMDGREGHDRYAPCQLDDLRSRGYDYWALGHVHTREKLSKDELIFFPGNVQGRHIRENGPKGCLVVTVDRGQAKEPRFEPLDVVRWERCEVDATGAIDADDVLTRTIDNLTQLTQAADNRLLAVRIEIQGACQAHAELLTDHAHIVQEIRSQTVQNVGDLAWIEKVKIRTKPPEQTLPSTGESPLEELRQLIQELRDNEQSLVELAAPLDELKRKLPPEIMGDDLALGEAATLRRLLDQVEPMLLQRLLKTESAS
ncbi:MAG TPA: DNA repair exonuclease [Gemmataceae bacterium]|jgi:DNA repair exonuclease SbcCD nuclease subunit|nr:DNA repair exonuclease [Gemmataceae bacterium]